MAGIFDKVSAFARSSQGKKLIQQAQAAAKDPANRAKVQEYGNKLKDAAKQASSKRAKADGPAAPDVHPDPDAPEPKTQP